MRPDLAFFQVLHQKVLFDDKQHEIVKAPADKVPVRTMPDAGQRPDGQHVQHLAPGTAAVAAQRDINVIPEPAGKADVPPPPEFGDRSRLIRRIKVEIEMKAQ